MKKDFKNVVITEDNIAKYYKSMSSDDKRENADILNSLINKRINNIVHKLPITRADLKNEAIAKCEILGERLYIGISFFGVEDTLKPIDEYIADIEANDDYNVYKYAKGSKWLYKNETVSIVCVHSDRGFATVKGKDRNLNIGLKELKSIEGGVV